MSRFPHFLSLRVRISLKSLGPALLLIWPNLLRAEPLPDPVAAQIARAEAEKKIESRLADLASIGKSLTLVELPTALKDAAALEQLRERVTLTESVMSRWGELAPSAAFDQVANWPENVSKVQVLHAIMGSYARQNVHAAAAAAVHLPAGRARNDAIEILSEVWAQKDPKGALQWARSLPPDGFPIDRAIRKVYFVWVHADPQTASSVILEYPRGDYKNALLTNVAEEWAMVDPQACLKWAESLPDGSEREIAVASAIESWADNHPAEAASSAVVLAPQSLRERAVTAALARWAGQDPQKALSWIQQLDDVSLATHGVGAVLEVWTPVCPEASGQWVEALPSGPLRESAIRSYIEAVKAWNPSEGARLALKSTDSSARVQLVEQCLRLWLLWDPASATRWLDQTDFPAELKHRWVSKLRFEES